jgi:hypothetical protein
MSSLSFWSTEDSLSAAAEAAFGQGTAATGEMRKQASPQAAQRLKEGNAVTEALTGLSCAISAHGEVILLRTSSHYLQYSSKHTQHAE